MDCIPPNKLKVSITYMKSILVEFDIMPALLDLDRPISLTNFALFVPIYVFYSLTSLVKIQSNM